MRFTSTHSHRQRPAEAGFTLVEVLIISPLVILVVAVIIAFMINMTGDALQTRERNGLIHTVQSGLDQVEADIRLAVRIVDSTSQLFPALANGQGSNANFSDNTHFVSDASTLVLEQYSTSANPYDPNRSLLYYANEPNPCGAQQRFNLPVKHAVVFFVQDNTLKRRTIIDFGGKTVCDGIVSNLTHPGLWQRNSCSTTNTSRCFTLDTVIASDVESVEFLYYDDPSDSDPSAASDSTRAARVTIHSLKSIAGEAVEYSASVQATRIQH